MSGSAHRRERPDMGAAGSLVDAIESILGPFSLVDLGFPRMRLPTGMLAEAAQMLRLPRAEIEREFLLRFRQAGGHAPIQSYDPAALETFSPTLRFERDGAPIVIAVDDLALCNACANTWREIGAPLLVPAPPERDIDAGEAFLRTVRFEDRRGGPDWLLLFPHDRRRAPHARRREPESVSCESGDPRVTIEARGFVHDGGHASEGDASYSWLWTGPSAHFRLVIPQPNGMRPRRIELCAPRTEDPANLERVAAQIDGRPVRHHVDRWSDTSGKIIADIPPGNDYIVLTLVVPAMTEDGNSGRMLGLCLDKAILAP